MVIEASEELEVVKSFDEVKGQLNNYLLENSLKYLEEMLPPAIFFRTHKSYLVNLNYVKSFDKKRGVAILENNKAIDVASRRVDEFIKALRVR